jgi:hypothetical protein
MARRENEVGQSAALYTYHAYSPFRLLTRSSLQRCGGEIAYGKRREVVVNTVCTSEGRRGQARTAPLSEASGHGERAGRWIIFTPPTPRL